MAEVGDEVPVISGVYADGSLEAARIAAMAAREGASALLIFPPQSMAMGGHLRPEMAVEHYRRIAGETDLPLIAFNYPLATGLGYPFDTLLKLFEDVPTIRAIKDWSNDAMLHEKSGAGSVIADLQVALFRAVKAGDLKAAQTINDRIFPLAQAFYATPFLTGAVRWFRRRRDPCRPRLPDLAVPRAGREPPRRRIWRIACEPRPLRPGDHQRGEGGRAGPCRHLPDEWRRLLRRRLD
jgi:dihydrodipicolinate synthase/N-acetylneuraminate lyase